jgi:hypothetical protein
MIILFSNEIRTDDSVVEDFIKSSRFINICCCGIYAHGDLEEKLGHDILGVPYIKFSSEKGFDIGIEEGVNQVNIVHEVNGEHINIPAVLFLWKTYKIRGLVVLLDDAESLRYATEQYLNKSSNL